MENKLNLENPKQKFLNDEISAEEYKIEKGRLEKAEEKTGEAAQKTKKDKKKSKEEKYEYECEGCGRIYLTFEEASKCEGTHSCCLPKTKREKGILKGIFYGLVPHTFCILFIVAAILGSTVAVSFFKPFLMSRYFFYILIALSFVFATISSLFYLKRNNCLCLSGIKKRGKYLSIMYTTTMGVNILFFLIIFPMVANFSAPSITGAMIAQGINLSDLPSLTLDVDIPCSGHAPLIIGELKSVGGVVDVKYKAGKFNVAYDSSQTSKESILSLEVFKTYPAIVVSESKSANERDFEGPSTGGGSCCGGGSCGCGGDGSCGA